MKLSDFLSDLTDTGIVRVEAKQLRKYVQQCNEWENVANSQGKTISELMVKIDMLENKLFANEYEKPVVIDLFA